MKAMTTPGKSILAMDDAAARREVVRYLERAVSDYGLAKEHALGLIKRLR